MRMPVNPKTRLYDELFKKASFSTNELMVYDLGLMLRQPSNEAAKNILNKLVDEMTYALHIGRIRWNPMEEKFKTYNLG